MSESSERLANIEDALGAVSAGLIRLEINLTERLDHHDDRLATLQHAGVDNKPKPDWKYRHVEDWVADWFVHVYARSVDNGVWWCPQWQEHREAVERLDAAWRAWEVCRRDTGRGMATWFTAYGDPLFYELTNSHGTFRSCTYTNHHQSPPLKAAPDDEGS